MGIILLFLKKPVNRNEKKKNIKEEKEYSCRVRAEGHDTIYANSGRWYSGLCMDVVDAATKCQGGINI